MHVLASRVKALIGRPFLLKRLNYYYGHKFERSILSIFRYIAICHPFRTNLRSGRRRSIYIIVATWIVGLIPSIAWTLFTRVRKAIEILPSIYGGLCGSPQMPRYIFNNWFSWKYRRPAATMSYIGRRYLCSVMKVSKRHETCSALRVLPKSWVTLVPDNTRCRV